MVLSCPFLVCFRIAIFILVFIIIYIYIFFFISVCYIFQTSYIIFESTSFKFLQLHHLAINLITCHHLAVIILCVCLASIVVPVCNVLYSIDVRVLIESLERVSPLFCVFCMEKTVYYILDLSTCFFPTCA